MLGLLECRDSKSNLILMQECFQKLIDDLDSSTISYGMDLGAWNGLQLVGSSTGMLSAKCLQVDLDFVILVLQMGGKCLDTFYMMFMKCLDDWL